MEEIKNRMEEAKRQKDYDTVFILYNSLITKLLKSKNYPAACEESLNILPLYKLAKDKKGEIRTNIFVAEIYNILSDFDNAIKYSKNALDLLDNYEDELSRAKVYKIMGIAYRLKGDFKESLDALFSANNFYNKNKDILELPENKKAKIDFTNMLEAIGIVYGELNQLETSREYFNKALKQCEKLNDIFGVSKNLNNLGVSYSKEDSEKTLYYYAQALGLVKKHNIIRLIAPYTNNIGGVYEDIKKYDKALGYYEKALKISEDYNQKHFMTAILKHIGNVYAKKNDYEKAFAALQKSLKISKEIKMEHEEKEILLLISQLYEKIGNYKISLDYFHEYSDLNDRTCGNVIHKKVSEIEKKYHMTKKELENMKIIEKQRLMLMQKSKLESLGQMASGIAHEINQPLGAITFALDNIYFKFEQNKLSTDYLEQKRIVLKDNLDRISEIISQIRTFSQTQKFFRMEKLNLNKLINDTLILLRTQYKNHNIDIELDLNKDIGFTVISRNQMEQVLLNLLSNARYAVEKKHEKSNDINSRKKIFIRTYSDDTNVYLEVEDNGIGISQEDINNIFDPFFTTKDVNHGTGLGLSITLGIIEKMHGTIEFKSEKDKYTIARIKLAKFVEKNKVVE